MTTQISAVADVTVIIPAYRAANTIGRALVSIAVQTLKPRAVVVVDDGSSDDTYAVTESYRERMPGIELVVIRQANAGPGAARNRALREANTRYVAFLDADDEWKPEKLARSMTHLMDGDYSLVAHDSVEVDGPHSERLYCARRFNEASQAPFVGLYRRGFIDTTTVVADLAVIRSLGGFDESLPNAQDFDLWLAILADPNRHFLVFDDVLSIYHRTPGSVMTHIERRRKCCVAIARRYASALRAHPGSPLVSLWFRLLAVHKEAVTAHARLGDWRAVVMTSAIAPVDFCIATLGYFVAEPPAPRASLN